jgi:Na+/proline symporter
VAIFTLVPVHALAEVCDKVRPFVGAGETGTALTEAASLMATPPSLVLLLLSAVAIRLRWQWAALGIVVLWSIWVSLVAMAAPDPAMQSAIDAGCVGPPTLFIALVAAICGGMILLTAPRKAKTDGDP